MICISGAQISRGSAEGSRSFSRAHQLWYLPPSETFWPPHFLDDGVKNVYEDTSQFVFSDETYCFIQHQDVPLIICVVKRERLVGVYLFTRTVKTLIRVWLSLDGDHVGGAIWNSLLRNMLHYICLVNDCQ